MLKKTGAGINAILSTLEISSGPIANNGLIVSGSSSLWLDCVSNSSQSGVGTITAPDGTVLTPHDSTAGVWSISSPFDRPGVVRFRTLTSTPLPASDQGIYTCTMPDSNGANISLNVGLYPHGFHSKITKNMCVFVDEL